MPPQSLFVLVEPSIPGPAIFNAPITVPFTIDETPNALPCTYPSATPCADKISFGTTTFALNSAVNGTVYDLSIGFVDPVTSATKDFTVREGGGTPVEIEASTITLDDLLSLEKVDRIDFLSMDIELAEPKALAGFDLRRCSPALVCIEAHRDRCLWFVRCDYRPQSDDERRWVLTEIQRRGDRATFAQAGLLKRCLSPTSSGASVVS